MDYLITPWGHQHEAITRAAPEPMPHFALFFEMGAGKTGTTINILRHKFQAYGALMRTFILCPPIVISNWKDEWLKHSKIPASKIILLNGSGQRRLHLFDQFAWDATGIPQGGIFVTNYESLLMKPLYARLMEWKPQALVLDESHSCKDQKSKRTKLTIRLSEKVAHKYILSGTPVLNTPMDLFTQFLILDGGATFGKNFWVFRARYFRDKNAGMPKDRHFPKWEVLPGALEEINRLIYRCGMRVLKKDCMDLPPLVRQVIKVPMLPEQARLYKEMKRDLITFLNDKASVATLAITKALRLQQIASGYIKTVDGTETSLDNNPKQGALRDLLEEITPHSKVLVWACWRQNYAQIRSVCESLGLEFVEVHGEISERQKIDHVARFNSDPKCRVFIGHPGSGGVGINLVAASYSIFYSRTFSLAHSLQAEARNHRGGSEIHTKITRIDLVSENTIDELVSEKLANKIEVSDTVLRDLSLELEKQEL